MVQPALKSHLDTYRGSNEIYQTPSYAFVILYLLVGYYVAYLGYLRRGSGVRTSSPRLWSSFCAISFWPISKLISICTISLKDQLNNDRARGNTCDSSQWSAYTHTRLWNWMLTSVFCERLWIPTPKYCLRGPPGLGNIDNSCYQNAVLQVIILPYSIVNLSKHLMNRVLLRCLHLKSFSCNQS